VSHANGSHATAGPAIEATDLSHAYGAEHALRGVSLTIPRGSMVGLLGPNGSGKTTFFRILTTLLQPTSGTVRVMGLPPHTASHAVRQHLGVVFQDTALDDELTVEENLRFHGALYGVSSALLAERIDFLLDRFGLMDRRSAYVKTLSGGLQRRADLCRGLLHRPQILLLDEPTTGLDPAARHAFWQTLHTVQQEEHMTIVLATHLMAEAERCTEVGILDRGRLVAQGPPAQLTSDLGTEVLLLETSDPSTLQDRIEAQFGVATQQVGTMVQITEGAKQELLTSLYDALADQISSATIRKPSLEDVFMAHAGYHLNNRPAASPITTPANARS